MFTRILLKKGCQGAEEGGTPGRASAGGPQDASAVEQVPEIYQKKTLNKNA